MEAAWGLHPSQRAAFEQQVITELQKLAPDVRGPDSLHRIIAAAQRSYLGSRAIISGNLSHYDRPRAHVARFEPDATAQIGVSCLGYKAHFSEATEPRTTATVAPAASWCGEITQENLSQGSRNSLPKSSIRRKFSFSFSRARARTCGSGQLNPRGLERIGTTTIVSSPDVSAVMPRPATK
jgi:hypothetical protein